jgi:hypothetical protein
VPAIAAALNATLARQHLLAGMAAGGSGSGRGCSGGGGGVHVRAYALGAVTGAEVYSHQSVEGGVQAGAKGPTGASADGASEGEQRGRGGGEDGRRLTIQTRGIAEELRSILGEGAEAAAEGVRKGGVRVSPSEHTRRRVGVHMNCEGCEYAVVEGLAAAGLLGSVHSITMGSHLLPQWDGDTYDIHNIRTMYI